MHKSILQPILDGLNEAGKYYINDPYQARLVEENKDSK